MAVHTWSTAEAAHRSPLELVASRVALVVALLHASWRRVSGRLGPSTAVAWCGCALDLASTDMYGRRNRVAQFLFQLLHLQTQRWHHAASVDFAAWCHRHRIVFDAMDVEEQDMCLSDYLLDLRDKNEPFVLARDCAAICQTCFPRRRCTTVWQVIKGWEREHPPRQAPPLPQDSGYGSGGALGSSGPLP